MSISEELLTCIDELYAMACITEEVVAATGAMSQADADMFNGESRRFETAFYDVRRRLDRDESDADKRADDV